MIIPKKDLNTIYRQINIAMKNKLNKTFTKIDKQSYQLDADNKEFWKTILYTDSLGSFAPFYEIQIDSITLYIDDEQKYIITPSGNEEIRIPLWKLQPYYKELPYHLLCGQDNIKNFLDIFLAKCLPEMNNKIEKILFYLLKSACGLNNKIETQEYNFWSSLKSAYNILGQKDKTGKRRVFIPQIIWDNVCKFIPSDFNLQQHFNYRGDWENISIFIVNDNHLKNPIITLPPEFCGVIPIRQEPIISFALKNNYFEGEIEIELGAGIIDSNCAMEIEILQSEYSSILQGKALDLDTLNAHSRYYSEDEIKKLYN